MGVPRRPEWPRLANFAQNWVSGKPDLGSETPDRGSGRPRSEIRGLGFGQFWPNLGSPRQISPLGERILVSKGGQNAVDLA